MVELAEPRLAVSANCAPPKKSPVSSGQRYKRSKEAPIIPEGAYDLAQDGIFLTCHAFTKRAVRSPQGDPGKRC